MSRRRRLIAGLAAVAAIGVIAVAGGYQNTELFSGQANSGFTHGRCPAEADTLSEFAPLMAFAARHLTDRDIEALAAYYGSLGKNPE